MTAEDFRGYSGAGALFCRDDWSAARQSEPADVEPRPIPGPSKRAAGDEIALLSASIDMKSREPFDIDDHDGSALLKTAETAW